MTVESTDRKQTYAGGQSELVFTFKAFTDYPEDIKCLKTLISTGAETVLTYGVDYTVDIEDDGIGGTVTIADILDTRWTFTVYRETTDKQESDYDDYNQFPADTVETDFDRRTMVSQERNEELDRVIKIPISSSGIDCNLPAPVANQLIGWDSTATGIENKDPIDASYIADCEAARDAALAAQAAAETAQEGAEAVAGWTVATQEEAETGTDNTTVMTPLRTAQAIDIREPITGDGTVNPTNLLSNGDFESWSAGTSAAPDGWTEGGPPTIARDTGDSGSYSVKITTGGGTYQDIHYTLTGLKASRTYSVSYRTKVTAGDTSRCDVTGEASTTAPKTSTSTTWETITFTFTTDASATNVVIYLQAVADGDIVWFDGIQVNEGASAFAFSPKPVSWVEGTANPTNLLSNGNFESWSTGTAAAPDGWTLSANASESVSRETNVKMGTYSALVTRSGADCGIYTSDYTSNIGFGKGIAYWKGRTVTFGCWVNAYQANRARIKINDAATASYSDYAPAGVWTYLTVTHTVSNLATYLYVVCQVDTADSYAYFDGAMLVEGTSAFAFSPKPAEEGVWADYSAASTIVGWSAYDGANTKLIYTKKIGKTVIVTFLIGGTSNSATTTFTVPYTCATQSGLHAWNTILITNSGTAAIGMCSIGDGTSTITCYRNPAGSAWTASGAKYVQGQIIYESA